eukprot:13121435-Alexandrium_andersonii.AAC.1
MDAAVKPGIESARFSGRGHGVAPQAPRGLARPRRGPCSLQRAPPPVGLIAALFAASVVRL